jgi:cell division protein FtsQ
LTYILMILDVVKEQEIAGTLEEIDFRTGVVVYRIREE